MIKVIKTKSGEIHIHGDGDIYIQNKEGLMERIGFISEEGVRDCNDQSWRKLYKMLKNIIKEK